MTTASASTIVASTWSGKATLDVVPNAAKPFYVFANEVVTKVLGTKFEVVAFDDGSDVTVKVLSGKVTVYQNNENNKEAGTAPRQSAILLLPNQLAVFDRKAELFAKRLVDRPDTVGSLQYSRVLALAGGLPIKSGNEVVGAVGVSGSPGKDDVCSQAGIDKVADQLK